MPETSPTLKACTLELSLSWANCGLRMDSISPGPDLSSFLGGNALQKVIVQANSLWPYNQWLVLSNTTSSFESFPYHKCPLSSDGNLSKTRASGSTLARPGRTTLNMSQVPGQMLPPPSSIGKGYDSIEGVVRIQKTGTLSCSQLFLWGFQDI